MGTQRIVVLGSTGSIGVSTLRVAAEHPGEFQVVGLAAGSRVRELAEQARAFRPKWVAVQDASRAAELRRLLEGLPAEILAGEEGVCELAGRDGVDRVVVAITGAAALEPTLRAISKGRSIGLANKETLVMAGELVMAEARRSGAQILPIDSEHSAIFQCLEGRERAQVRRILLTTSGGPLKDVPAGEFGRIPKRQVMDHPRWKMGPKITVDSATLMNKALEVIEARSLFGLPADQVEVLVHPEAVVHSMVEFIDGSVLAQLAVTDMRIPIQYALTYPDRLPSGLPPLDLAQWKRLTFEPPQREKFPCLEFGYRAARAGGTAPAVLNAANERCVQAFLDDMLPFVQIPSVIEKVLSRHRAAPHPDLAQILQADAWAREEAASVIAGNAAVLR
ncbi:MAG: 1-deoxy-D-xylulose-5-phosphate reductoisomerase [Candidatus Omnitrophica bacterium]|nr:1-deoxy-D-xylulose-5-phosphate reductoisomerase [Candidatus Omnitrophota bacterium]